jgi:predicted aspartyl protease
VKLSSALLLISAGLLLAAQACFAEDQWAGPYGASFGPKARTELNRLGLKGRTAFKNALIACGLYVDEISDARKEECKAALKAFEVEFSSEHSAILLLFDDAIIGAGIWEANAELGIRQGRRKAPGINTGRADIADLQKIYRDITSVAGVSPVRSPEHFQSTIESQILVPLQRKGGTFVVPILINKRITLDFVVDSGAADVSIPADVVLTLVRTGTLQEADFIGTQTYRLADGSTAPSTTFRIRSLSANKLEIGNVKASIAPVAGELLLGQSFLSRFKSWSIDNAKQALVLTQ